MKETEKEVFPNRENKSPFLFACFRDVIEKPSMNFSVTCPNCKWQHSTLVRLELIRIREQNHKEIPSTSTTSNKGKSIPASSNISCSNSVK